MELINQISCEVEEVLAHTKIELVQKIPSNIRDIFIRNSKDITEYKAKYNPDISLEEQNLLKETKAILTLLYRDYWCTEEGKKELEKILDENERIYQEELRKKYNPNVFNNNEVINKVSDKEKDLMPEVIKPKKWYEKIFEKIAKIFNHNKN